MEEKDYQQEIEKLVNEVQKVVRQIMRRIRLQTPDDISLSQASVITRLDVPGGLTNAELARAEGVKPQSMSSIVADLEAEGYIQRSPHPADGRRIVLSLTEAGRQVRQSRLAAKQQWLNSIIEQLSPQERQELQRGLDILNRITK